jgi:hypothetical protein
MMVWSAALPLSAVDIPIANAGFEHVVLPCAPGSTCWTPVVAAWTASGQFATFKPPTGAGGVFNAVPEGVNTAMLGAVAGAGDGVLFQNLGAALQPDTTYTLSFRVGSRSDYAFAGYNVELLAGSTVLAADSSLAPPSGTFVTGRIVYSSVAHPALLGQQLGIRLTGKDGGQTNFDQIALDATANNSLSSAAAQIASGGGWKTTATIVNLSPARNAVRVAFRGDDGRALSLPLVVTQQRAQQTVTASSVDRTLEPGASLIVESEAPAASATLTGWAEVASTGPVAGFAIFRYRSPGGSASEGTAELDSGRISTLILPYDNTAGFATGIALVNLTSEAAIVNATIRDDNGTQIGLEAVSLAAMGHTAFNLADRYAITAGQRGIIEFRNQAGGAITGLGLRFSPLGTFTSVPVMTR